MTKSFKTNLLIAFTVLFNIVCSGQNDIPEKPNVIFIAVDDLNDWAGYLGGHSQSKTSNIDKFAKKGVDFSYGPLALAEKLNSKNDFSVYRDKFNRMAGRELVRPEPFININAKNIDVLLDKLIPIEGSQARFKIAESDIELMPYFQTASNYSGPRTYFYLG